MWCASSLQIFRIKVQQQIRKLIEYFRTNWSFSVAFLLDLSQSFSSTNTNHKTYSTNQLTVIWRGRDLEYWQGEECWLAVVCLQCNILGAGTEFLGSVHSPGILVFSQVVVHRTRTRLYLPYWRFCVCNNEVVILQVEFLLFRILPLWWKLFDRAAWSWVMRKLINGRNIAVRSNYTRTVSGNLWCTISFNCRNWTISLFSEEERCVSSHNVATVLSDR